MLSYRHLYHAGNHADVLKHLTLCLMLRHLNVKDKPYCLIDTHAGAGVYELRCAEAQKNLEFQSGVERIADCKALMQSVPEYYEVLHKAHQRSPSCYPGSPYFAASLSRESDKLWFFELHPRDEQSLFEQFRQDPRITVQRRDSLAALKAILPPQPRRGLCFIDPAFEEQNEYYEVLKALKSALKRWNTGIFALWYPVLGRLRDYSKNLRSESRRLNVPLLQLELRVSAQGEDLGMCGSGLLIYNYPFGLEKELSSVLQILKPLLCSRDGLTELNVLVPQP